MDAIRRQPRNENRVYLARHGRTELNARGLLRGRLDPDLDGVGRDEAHRLGEALASAELTDVVSSPLSRALQTAEAIAARFDLAVRVDARLADRDYGRWAGWTVTEIEAEWGSVDEAPGVEPAAEVRARALEAMDAIRETGRSTCAAVSHDAVIRAILCALEPSLCEADRISQPTGCVNVLDWDHGSWSIVATGLLPREASLRMSGSADRTWEWENA